MKKQLLAVLSSTAILATSTMTYASDSNTFSPDQQEQIGKIAADYLVKHPEILIKVSQELQKKQQQAEQSALTMSAVKAHDNLMKLDGIPHIGPKEAKVTVTEFFDYQCLYCHKMAPEVEQLMKANPNVTFIFRDWPIFASRWEASGTAATTGLEIWHQKGPEAYLSYHNGIFATGHDEGKLTNDDIQKVAEDALKAPYKKTSDTPYKKTIMINDQLSRQVGFKGTPGFIITPAHGATVKNTTVIGGAVDEETLQAAIDRALNN
ncbi:disulfide bond formation protein DsbA [Marinomonas sp. CT5]|uniref:DsbA family protein n=1 Tax=Marinomonas sp. CT5 TaxID=2066133 RepID=UPI0017C92DE1|nr:DsbA family protein [Marinomonas sp. CT5]NVK72598.1 DsbA family protein [Oceanospirillaceae bacterium]QUX94052.1 disulfide bond formation protein DsbA [Marinomonas sp. CT5]